MSVYEPQHVCRASNNPRKVGRCDCGEPLPPPSPAKNRHRNIDFERNFTEWSAKGKADPSYIIEHSENRASALSGEYVSDPMLVQVGRDRQRDVREELSDARNHLCWLVEDNFEDEDLKYRSELALGLIVQAYNVLLDT